MRADRVRARRFHRKLTHDRHHHAAPGTRPGQCRGREPVYALSGGRGPPGTRGLGEPAPNVTKSVQPHGSVLSS
jgi:hypothetical protein